MIKKVLIAEDHESANISVQMTLEELGIAVADHVYYCDDALLYIEKALKNGVSYDLLITDLSFEEDHRPQKIKNGEMLIAAVRKIQSDLRILVFSAENRSTIITQLFEDAGIDGYVRKARGDARELVKAINHIGNNLRYCSQETIQLMKRRKSHDFSELDIAIISQMVNGKKQQEISDYLKTNNMFPSSKSTIEKRLNYIKDALDFSTNEQLIAHCVKMGIV
ncbi:MULTISPECIES: response regulator [Chitinophagaceae]